MRVRMGFGVDVRVLKGHLRLHLRRPAASHPTRTHRNPEPHAKRQSQSMDHAVAGLRGRLIA
jgi:hypothetical protein